MVYLISPPKKVAEGEEPEDPRAELVRRLTGSTSEIVHVPYERAYAQGFEDMARRMARACSTF